MKLALKVDVDTLRGTREGVPSLIELFHKHGVYATFLFSLGPDHTGRAIKRVFRRGFMGKVQRTSVVKHYGARTRYGLRSGSASTTVPMGADVIRICRYGRPS